MEKVDAIKYEIMERGEFELDASEISQRIRTAIFGENTRRTKKWAGEFVEWFERFTDTHAEGEKTYRCYRHTLSRLRAYCPKRLPNFAC